MRCSPIPLALTLLFLLVPGCQEHAWTPPSKTAMPTPLGVPPSPVLPGIIEGDIRLSGTPPTPSLLPTSPSVASVCGPTVPDRSLVVGPGGALAHVVVALSDGTNAPAPDPNAPSAVLDQKQCTFEPPVLAARVGTLLEVLNSDALLHHVNALSGSQRSIINVALPIEGSRVRRPLPGAPGILQVRCDLHPWMRATVRTFEHPWFTTSGNSGHFRLEVPPGTHSVLLWHPRLPGVTRSLSVRAGETVRLDHVWAAEEVRDAP